MKTRRLCTDVLYFKKANVKDTKDVTYQAKVIKYVHAQQLYVYLSKALELRFFILSTKHKVIIQLVYFRLIFFESQFYILPTTCQACDQYITWTLSSLYCRKLRTQQIEFHKTLDLPFSQGVEHLMVLTCTHLKSGNLQILKFSSPFSFYLNV